MPPVFYIGNIIGEADLLIKIPESCKIMTDAGRRITDIKIERKREEVL